MKRIEIIAALLLAAISSFAQNGKSIISAVSNNIIRFISWQRYEE